MKIKTFPFFFTLIACVLFVMCGHKDNKKYCPAYPREKTDYAPVSQKGKKMHYLVGKDTVALVVGSPVFSPKYYSNPWLEVLCECEMSLFLYNSDSSSHIKYTIRGTSEDNYSVYIDWFSISGTHKNKEFSIWFSGLQPLNQWTSPTGETFENVAVQTNGEDSIYLSKSKGLLRYAPDPEKSNAEEWLLLPEN